MTNCSLDALWINVVENHNKSELRIHINMTLKTSLYAISISDFTSKKDKVYSAYLVSSAELRSVKCCFWWTNPQHLRAENTAHFLMILKPNFIYFVCVWLDGL